ncbi:MAG: hypothetical protein ABQ298_00425 [Puniceicoccaceae bacterium]
MSKAPHNGLSAYQNARKLESSVRLENLLAHYDGLRQAAARHDRMKVEAMVLRLEQSLQFEANPVFAWRLTQLYGHIRSAVKREDFQEACRVADELYCMWQHASALMEPGTATSESTAQTVDRIS